MGSKYSLIKQLAKERGTNVSQVERDLGFAKGSLSKIDKHDPSLDKVAKLCAYFNIGPMTLMGNLDDAKRYTEALNNLPSPTITKAEPVFQVSAGNGCFNDSYPSEELDIEQSDEVGYCKIVGDSMHPILQDGDTVVVHKQTETLPTDLTVIRIDGEALTCKYVEVAENGLWVRAENKDVYEDRFYTVQEVLSLPISIVGKAVALKRKL